MPNSSLDDKNFGNAHASLFDPHLPLANLEEDDVANLAYFGLREAICVRSASALQPQRRRSRERESMLLAELRRYGVTTHVALGWQPFDLPQRAVAEPFAELRRALMHEEVGVVGPLGLDLGTPTEVDAMAAQLRLAVEFEVPAYVRWGSWTQNAEATLFETLEQSDAPFDSVVFVDVPMDKARPFAVSGRKFSVRVPPSGLDPVDVSEFVTALAEASSPPAFGTSLSANRVDVTAIARLHSGLTTVASERIRRVERELIDGATNGFR